MPRPGGARRAPSPDNRSAPNVEPVDLAHAGSAETATRPRARSAESFGTKLLGAAAPSAPSNRRARGSASCPSETRRPAATTGPRQWTAGPTFIDSGDDAPTFAPQRPPRVFSDGRRLSHCCVGPGSAAPRRSGTAIPPPSSRIRAAFSGQAGAGSTALARRTRPLPQQIRSRRSTAHVAGKIRSTPPRPARNFPDGEGPR